MSIVRIISFTEAGYQLSCKMQDCLQERAEVVLYSGKNQVAERHAEVCVVSDGLKNWCSEVFDKSEVLIFVGACGIEESGRSPLEQQMYRSGSSGGR